MTPIVSRRVLCGSGIVFEPVFRGEPGYGLVGVAGDLGERVIEAVEGFDAEAASFDQCAEDGAGRIWRGR